MTSGVLTQRLGLILPSVVGPAELDPEIESEESVDPTAIAPSWSAGEFALEHIGPLFPMAKTGMISAAAHAAMISL